MQLTTRAAVKGLLMKHGLCPRKNLGQHFLVNEVVLHRLLAAANLVEDDVVVEIGPGLGTLTRELAERVRLVIAVELDATLLPVLEETCAGCRVHVVRGNALQVNFDALASQYTDGEYGHGGKPYKLVANLPYYITGPLLTRLVTANFHWSWAVLTVQLEVGRRLVARPGTKEYGVLTLMVQYHAEAELMSRIPPEAFYPAPEVASAIVRLRRRQQAPVAVRDAQALFSLIRAAFGQRRKTILNALTGAGDGTTRSEWSATLLRAGIDPMRRGETLSLEEFARLADAWWERRGGQVHAVDQPNQRAADV